MRTPTIVAILLLPALVVFAPPAPAQSSGGHLGWDMELLHPPVGATASARVLYRDAEWRPGGNYALIVGGIRGPQQDPCAGWSYVMSFDGSKFEILRNQSGCMLYSMSWAPDGSHALMVGERNTILKFDAATKAFTDVWALSSFAAAGENFLPRAVAYKPDGSMALITGNDLLRFFPGKNGQPDLLAPGSHRQGEFFDAVKWEPNGKYAILESGVTDRNNTRALGMISFYSEDAARCAAHKAPAAPCIYHRVLYGQYDPGFNDIDGITFGPLGGVAWIYGLDGGHGSIMRYGEQEDSFSFPYAYVHANTRITSMSWQPNSYKVLWTAGSSKQLFLSEGWRFTTLLDNPDCGVRWPQWFKTTCPSLKEAVWHPTGEWAFVIGGTGWFFKFKPRTSPSVDITSPVENVDLSADSVLVRGFAVSQQTTRKIDRVEYRIDGGAWTSVAIAKPEPTVVWNFTLDLTKFPGGSRRLLEARASDDGGATWSPPIERKFFIKSRDPNAKHPTLTLVAANGNTVDNGFNLTWNAVPNATYVLQRSKEPTFASFETLYSEEARLEFPSHAKGTWHFRVQARGGVAAGDWSNAVSVLVKIGPDRNAKDGDDLVNPNPRNETKPPPDRVINNSTKPGGNPGGDPPPAGGVRGLFNIPHAGLAGLAVAAAAAVLLARRR